MNLTLQLSLKASGQTSADRRVLRPASDSSEDSEGDFDDDEAAHADRRQQQRYQQELQHDENVRMEQDLHNLRKEQAEAAESLLQQVGAIVLSPAPL
jgi:TATA-binding protein-associated factor Taf7